jgi:hypothetical protein
MKFGNLSVNLNVKCHFPQLLNPPLIIRGLLWHVWTESYRECGLTLINRTELSSEKISFCKILVPTLNYWGFLRKIQKMYFFPGNQNTNGTIRKCFPRAFQWMVMSVYFENLKYFGQFLCQLSISKGYIDNSIIYDGNILWDIWLNTQLRSLCRNQTHKNPPVYKIMI